MNFEVNNVPKSSYMDVTNYVIDKLKMSFSLSTMKVILKEKL